MDEPQIIRTPSGDEMVIIPRAEYEALIAAAHREDEDDVAVYDARKAALAAIPAGSCTLMPQSVEGPYYLDPKLIRADVTEGHAGLPLALKLRVVGADCAPLSNARVDLWHCDPRGVYSGAIGYLGADGRADLSIAIRTIVNSREGMTIGAGGAITVQSDADAELRELLLKARAPLEAVGLAVHGRSDAARLESRSLAEPIAA